MSSLSGVVATSVASSGFSSQSCAIGSRPEEVVLAAVVSVSPVLTKVCGGTCSNPTADGLQECVMVPPVVPLARGF